MEFQSTPSARRATAAASVHWFAVPISIHALREEGDSTGCSRAAPTENFNPRPPRGGRLHYILYELDGFTISIHALREEGDENLQAV